MAIVLGMGLGLSAQQNDGGLFQRGEVSQDGYYGSAWYIIDQNINMNGGGLFGLVRSGIMPDLPDHNQDTNQPSVPVGGGAVLLCSLGAAYALRKRLRE